MHWQRIEDLRIDNDLSQQQTDNILNCKHEVYRSYEKEIRKLPLSYVIILVKGYLHYFRLSCLVKHNKFPDKREKIQKFTKSET